MPFSSHGVDIGRMPVTFNLASPTVGSHRNKFFWNIWPHSEKFVPTVGQPHEGKSVHVNSYEVTIKDISGVHSGISRDWMTGFHRYMYMPRLALRSVHKNCTMYTETNAACCSTGNEATVHCVLLNLRAWIVTTNLNNPPRETTGPYFVSEIFFICGRWSKFFNGSAYFVIK